MNRLLTAATLLGTGLLSGCAMTGPSHLRVHEALLYGGAQERIVWVYGDLSGAQSSVRLSGATVDLRAQVSDPLAVTGSLSVGGKATFRQATGALRQPLSVSRLASGQFTVSPLGDASVSAVYFTDGQTWTKLSGTRGVVGGVKVDGLQRAGALTTAEAHALGDALISQGPLVVAVLDPAQLLDGPLSVEPAPGEYLRTGLYILPNVPLATATAPGSSVIPPSSAPAGGNVTFTEIASGTNAVAQGLTVLTARTAAEARDLYVQAYGRQSSVPTPPGVTGRTLVGVFLGQRATGGYGVQVVAATASGPALTLRVRLSAPSPRSLTTQALTSPWTIVSVPGTYGTVSVVDENGQALPAGPGVTR